MKKKIITGEICTDRGRGTQLNLICHVQSYDKAVFQQLMLANSVVTNCQDPIATYPCLLRDGVLFPKQKGTKDKNKNPDKNFIIHHSTKINWFTETN